MSGVSAPNAEGSAPTRLHLTHVEGLRALAALVVFVNHAYAQTWYPGNGQYATGIFAPFAYSLVAGHLAVSVFIVVSGFCLALPVIDSGDQLRKGTLDFFKRRARRILPPYYAALVLSLVLIGTLIGEPTGTLWDVPIQADWISIVSHLLLLQDLFGTGKINYVFWSIAVEWHIYFAFPLLVWAVRRFGIFRVTLAALVVGYAMRFAFDGTRVERANPHYLGLFVCGMLGAYIARSPKPVFVGLRNNKAWGWLAGFSCLVASALCVVFGYQNPEPYFHYVDLPVGIMAMAVLVFTTAHRSAWLTRTLNFKLIAFIGTFSYSVYLLHAPLLQLLWQYVLHPLDLSPRVMFVTLMTVGAVSILGGSFAFFKLFEEPFMRKRRQVPLPEQVDAAPVAP